MAMTLNSSVARLMPVAEFLKRVSGTSVGQLASEDPANPIAVGSLATDPNVLAALKDADGLFEASCLMGNRYQAADLVTLSGTDCAAQGLMFRILADLAWAFLWERRPNKGIAPPPSLDRSVMWLEQLAQGKMLFGFVQAEKAGTLDSSIETIDDVIARNGTTWVAARFFGIRGNMAGPTAGFSPNNLR